MTTMTDPILRSWLLALESANAAPKTLKSYGAAVQSLDDYLEDRPLTEATRADIRGWVKHLRENGRQRPTARRQTPGLAPATLRLWFSTVRQFYRWVIEEGEEDLTRNPTENIPVPTLSKDVITPTLTEEQWRKLLAVPGSTFLARRDTALFYVMVDGGLRRSEACGLTLSDINLDTGAMFIRAKGSDRAERNRTTQLGIRARQALDRYLRARSKRPYAADQPALWLSSWGNGALSTSGFQDIFERHGKRIGVPHLHPHMLRHTWASEFRRAGGSEGDLLVLGGWSSRAMLDRYGKADAADRARDAYRKLSVTDRAKG